MIVTTTNQIENFEIKQYIGIVVGEVVLGLNFFKDWVASIKDWTGGHITQYEDSIKKGTKKAIQTMVERARNTGANAIIGVNLDYEVMSPRGRGTVITIIAWGTAVYVQEKTE